MEHGGNVANAGVQLALEAMRAAVETVSKMEDDYSFWMSQLKRQTHAMADRRAVGEGEDASQELQDTKEGLKLASRSLNEARKEVSSARAELNCARQFFVQVGGSNSTNSSDTSPGSAASAGWRSKGRQSLSRVATTTGCTEGGSTTESEGAWMQLSSAPETLSSTSLPRRQSLEQATEQQTPKSKKRRQTTTRSNYQMLLLQQTPTPIQTLRQRAPVQTPTQQEQTPTRAPTQQHDTPEPAAPPSVKRQRIRTVRLSTPPNRLDYERRFVWQKDGEKHHFPVDLDIPRCLLLEAWQLWCCGDLDLAYPPYRILRTSDIAARKLTKVYCEYRFLMIWLEEEVRAKGAWPERGDPTLEEATKMLDQAKPAIAVLRGEGRRKPPVEELTWRTIASRLRRSTCDAAKKQS
ncbi:hypothetical protein PRIC2_001809 [Phytophthora ramorum]